MCSCSSLPLLIPQSWSLFPQGMEGEIIACNSFTHLLHCQQFRQQKALKLLDFHTSSIPWDYRCLMCSKHATDWTAKPHTQNTHSNRGRWQANDVVSHRGSLFYWLQYFTCWNKMSLVSVINVLQIQFIRAVWFTDHLSLFLRNREKVSLS